MAAKKTGLMPAMTHTTSTTAALRFATSTAVTLRPQAPYVDRPALGVMVSTSPAWATSFQKP
ncbi:hypothetical protein LTR97_003048 [Elasticomyces elasticus]|uniref:Uncharacterized protein n=1 Tax=Elasticomyces elasticus TaxID=574655 RepID=A0AAN7WNW4_9PEZI|nr:hypothetical protein LTR97_003048 [Elasticomyces elasticus]